MKQRFFSMPPHERTAFLDEKKNHFLAPASIRRGPFVKSLHVSAQVINHSRTIPVARPITNPATKPNTKNSQAPKRDSGPGRHETSPSGVDLSTTNHWRGRTGLRVHKHPDHASGSAKKNAAPIPSRGAARSERPRPNRRLPAWTGLRPE